MATAVKKEDQNTEYKAVWRDEYLKWVCGFANAQGGTICIGIDDNGVVAGVKDAARLMEDIPNKIQSGLGIVAEVDRLRKDGRDVIEIRVAPSSFPVNYHGEYHYRSGSTKQQLTGAALTEFILRKTGFHWEDATVDGIGVDDLDGDSFRIFRREALRRKRMDKEELAITNAELLEKLHLLRDGKLKRSAVLLFHGDPSIVQVGSHVQIGRFGHGADLQYQDLLEGSLISTADKVVDLIYLKYLKAKITYEHDRRLETYPFAREAVREAVYNAIVHNCYMFGTPVQIRVEDDALVISNQCFLPEGWTVDTLMQPHESRPYNPEIANVFYRAGYIEHWGRGIRKICDACRELGAELPLYEMRGTGLRVRFKALESALVDSGKRPQTDIQTDIQTDTPWNSIDQIGRLGKEIMVLVKSNPTLTISDMARKMDVTSRTIEREVAKLRSAKKIARIGGKRFGHWIVL
jgi:ATP-dependent DNA helicase RecG